MSYNPKNIKYLSGIGDGSRRAYLEFRVELHRALMEEQGAYWREITRKRDMRRENAIWERHAPSFRGWVGCSNWFIQRLMGMGNATSDEKYAHQPNPALEENL